MRIYRSLVREFGLLALRFAILPGAGILLGALVLTPLAMAQQEIFIPPQGCTDEQWLKRAYMDVLYRQPTRTEIAGAFGAGQDLGGLPPISLFGALPFTREAYAAALVLGEEYRADVIGGNPGVVKGYYHAGT